MHYAHYAYVINGSAVPTGRKTLFSLHRRKYSMFIMLACAHCTYSTIVFARCLCYIQSELLMLSSILETQISHILLNHAEHVSFRKKTALVVRAVSN